VRLHAVGGLCNRLRAILSSRAVHGSLTVVWEPDEYVSHARFGDVFDFDCLAGVTFVDAGPWDVESYSVAEGAPADWERAYVALRPVATARRRIESLLSQRTLAVHVRRTDHLPNHSAHGGNVEPLEAWGRWSQEWPSLPVYVATDNGETQDAARRMWTDARFVAATRLHGAQLQAHDDHRRNGSLLDAVVDLYVCAGAERFRGSHGSSFTDTIATLRRLGGRS